MISVRENSSEYRSSIPDRVQAFFQTGGVLEKACAHEAFAFEVRPQQMAMADAVALALLKPEHLAVEAGTGVGKTFAYLVPLILSALEAKKPVAVSTYTINLQEQIVFKDIPFLQRHMGLKFETALCKGRQNYLCLRRLARARQMSSDLFHKAQERELDRIQRWADETKDGSLSDFSTASDVSLSLSRLVAPSQATGPQPSPEVWSQVCSEHDNCLSRKCLYYGRCFLVKARNRAFEANLLILNHHLFFSDLALRLENVGLLPDFKTLVLDEAHCLEDTASEHLGLRLSQAGIEHWLRRLYVPESRKGLLVALKEKDLAQAVSKIWEDVEHFFMEVQQWAKLEGKETKRTVTAPPAFSILLSERLTTLVHPLKRFCDKIEDPDVKAELETICRRGLEIRDSLDMFLTQSQPDQVYWVEREGVRRRQYVLYSAPIEVGPILEEILFNQFQSIIMTSAALSVNSLLSERADDSGRLAYFRKRVGAVHCRELVVGSPFNYSRQMRVFIAGDMPDPAEEEAFMDAAVRAIAFFVRKTHGRAFALFTSAEMMKTVASRLQPFFADEGMKVWVQGEGLPRHVMLTRFICDGGVLFGLDSFWMGVDVRGEALSNVIIVRLPFAVPDEPVTKARMDRITAQGGDAFREYSLPAAILKFRQGVGRLIRTATDEGIIAILDPRIVSRWYGRFFLNAIPECPVEVVSIGRNAECGMKNEK